MEFLLEKFVELYDFTVMNPVFCFLCLCIIISAIYVVTLKNVFHSAIFLILTLFSVAGIYILLDAEFLAVSQVLIYVGAVSVLMIFAIMLTSRIASKSVRQTNEQVMTALFICAVFLMITLTTVAKTVWSAGTTDLPANNILTIGKLLMTYYVLPFEVVSVVLLAALIGAIVLSRRAGS